MSGFFGLIVICVIVWIAVYRIIPFLVRTWRVWCPQGFLNRYLNRRAQLQLAENTMFADNWYHATRFAEALRVYQQRNDIQSLGAIIHTTHATDAAGNPLLTPEERQYIRQAMHDVHFSESEPVRRIQPKDIFGFMPPGGIPDIQRNALPEQPQRKITDILPEGVLRTLIAGAVILAIFAMALSAIGSSGIGSANASVRGIPIPANSSGKVPVGTVGQDGCFRFTANGNINFGTDESNGPGGSSWHTGSEYGDKTIRQDIPTGALLIQVGDSDPRALSELAGPSGTYEVKGTPGQSVYALINESPGNFSDNTGSFGVQQL